MKISQLATATGVPAETIRYYEREKLLPPPARQENGYRAYTDKHVEQLAFIKHCRSLDISIADTALLLEFTLKPQTDCSQINQLIEQQLLKIRARLVSLTALEKQLEKVSKTISAQEKQIHALSRQRSNPAGGAIVPMVSALAGTRKNGWGPTLAVLGWNLFRMAMESRKKSNKVQ